MTTKEYLSRYNKLNTEINSLCSELSTLRALLYQTGSSRIDGQPKTKHRHSAAQYEALVDKLVTAEADVNAKIDAAVDVRNEIAATIDAVENITYRTLLRYRYICCYKWDRKAVKMHRELRWIYRLHGQALQKIILN